jgi:hypothetical protein
MAAWSRDKVMNPDSPARRRARGFPVMRAIQPVGRARQRRLSTARPRRYSRLYGDRRPPRAAASLRFG